MQPATCASPAARDVDAAMDRVRSRPSRSTGCTIPVVPRIDSPPTMPSRGFQVFFASSSPPGTEISISTSRPAPDHAPRNLRDRLRIIRRGTGLIAGSPGAIGRPGRVTVPTPSPALNRTPLPARAGAHGGEHDGAMRDVGIVAGVLDDAGARARSVAAARAREREGSAARRAAARSRPGRGIRPVSSAAKAALAAAVAQAPVVQPRRSGPAGLRLMARL